MAPITLNNLVSDVLARLYGDLPAVALVLAVFIAAALLGGSAARRLAGRKRPNAGEASDFAGLWLRIVLVLAMALPMLVLYAVSTLGLVLSRDLEFPPARLGFLVMSSFGLASLLSPWAGAFVDRRGSRIGLMLLFAVIGGAFALMVSADHFYGLAAASALCGIAQALANPVTNLLIAERVAPAGRAGTVGLKQSGVQFAALFAGLVLPSLALTHGWRLALAPVIPSALLLFATVPLITPRTHQGAGRHFVLAAPNGLLLQLMAIQFCVGVSLSAFVTFLPTFASHQGLSPALAGSLIAVFGVMGIFSRIILTPLGAKLNDESYLLLALLAVAALALAVTMQAAPDSQWCLWAGAAGVGLTAVGTNAIAMSMLIRDARFGRVAVASGFVSVAFFGGFALGPPLYGHLAAESSVLGWSFLIAVLLLGCVMTMLLADARHKAKEGEAMARFKEEFVLLKNRVEALESQRGWGRK
jgi:CP family cyanate transporter-like MFS transporter